MKGRGLVSIWCLFGVDLGCSKLPGPRNASFEEPPRCVASVGAENHARLANLTPEAHRRALVSSTQIQVQVQLCRNRSARAMEQTATIS